ncbi:hypothetical protein N185_32795 [Sinorhizobium sp. GW3]|nr:hypothetical protein N185_32795 [Sinorhizobium sp. GW3]
MRRAGEERLGSRKTTLKGSGTSKLQNMQAKSPINVL